MSVLPNAEIAARTRPARISVGFIVGPTGAGKSALAMEVADRTNCEIVNADSRQFYRGMDLGTAKPSAEDRRRVPHHLIDVRDPDESLDVAEFAQLARASIDDIAARGRNPLVVGGSGLYLRVIRGGIFRGPPASPEIRDRLAKVAADQGVAHLHQKLRKIDPEAANRIGVNDLYRIVRALEVFELTGETISAHQRRHRFADIGYDILTVGVEVERKKLYEAIDSRFDAMLAAGLVEEVRALVEAGYSPGKPPLSTIGYKQIAAYLRREIALDEAVTLAKQESRRLAKRQLTWFRREPEIVWLDPERGAHDALALFEKFFRRRKKLKSNHNGHKTRGGKNRGNGIATTEAQSSDPRSAIERVRLARHANRPQTLDYIDLLMRDFIEIHGDRHFADDGAIVAGLAYFGHRPVAVVGHQRGRSTSERIKRNFGKPHPEGYRKAMRVYELAERFGLPIITLIDTQGAESGVGAEERGQTEAIARNLELMARAHRTYRHVRDRRGRLGRRARTGSGEHSPDAGERVLLGDHA